MGVAAVAGLLIPASEEGSTGRWLQVSSSASLFLALALARRRFSPDAGSMGRTGPGARTLALLFLVLFVHSLPMAGAGFGRGRQFWAAAATSAPQPVGALVAFFA
jgi:zinc transporter ZupT